MASNCARTVLDALDSELLPPPADVLELTSRAREALSQLESLVRIEVPVGAVLHVVGDLHGQYAELEKVLLICGEPEDDKNFFVFNGDFVDRGPCSVEIMLALLARFLLHPTCVHLNRGNHETVSLNRVYGFAEEVRYKYSQDVLQAFQDTFQQLPIGALVNNSVLVIHGGLPMKDGVTLSEIEAIDRKQEPRGDSLMLDLLWSDPMEASGRRPSPRGAGVLFGPDVSRAFCEANDLVACIRSHQVVHNGYRWHHDHCLTVFSAANYCGRAGNKGAVCHLRPRGLRLRKEDFEFTAFDGELMHPRSRL